MNDVESGGLNPETFGIESEKQALLEELKNELKSLQRQKEIADNMAVMQRTSLSSGGYFDAALYINKDLPKEIDELQAKIKELEQGNS